MPVTDIQRRRSGRVGHNGKTVFAVLAIDAGFDTNLPAVVELAQQLAIDADRIQRGAKEWRSVALHAGLSLQLPAQQALRFGCAQARAAHLQQRGFNRRIIIDNLLQYLLQVERSGDAWTQWRQRQQKNRYYIDAFGENGIALQ